MTHRRYLAVLEESARVRGLASKWDAARIQPLRDAIRALLENPLLPSEANLQCFTEHLLFADLRDEVAQEIFVFKAIDFDLSEFALAALSPGQVACDIGAHIGYHTHLLALAVGTEGRVFSFEPTPRTFGYLEKNTAWMVQVETINMAVGDLAGRSQFFDFGPDLGAYNSRVGLRLEHSDRRATREPYRLEVDQCRLDDFLSDRAIRPDYIKIDVESYEMQVLHGMQRILREERPTLAVEVGDFPHLVEAGVPTTLQIIDHLGSYGYRPFEFRLGNLEPHRVQSSRPYDYMNLFFLHLEASTPGRNLIRK